MDNRYAGRFDNDIWYQVFKNSQPFTHKRSYKYVKHSPDGFAWGYGGSGPSQLAFALLLEETNNVDLSLKLYQEYKREVIAALPQEGGWSLTSKDIKDWVNAHKPKDAFELTGGYEKQIF